MQEELKQLLTKEEINPIYPAKVAGDFFSNLRVGKEHESILIRIVSIRKKKILQYAMNHTDDDFITRLSNEEVEFYKQIRGAITKLNEGLLDIPLGFVSQSSSIVLLPSFPQ